MLNRNNCDDSLVVVKVAFVEAAVLVTLLLRCLLLHLRLSISCRCASSSCCGVFGSSCCCNFFVQQVADVEVVVTLSFAVEGSGCPGRCGCRLTLIFRPYITKFVCNMPRQTRKFGLIGCIISII